MTAAWGLHWFRRDLRVAGNPALRWSWKRHEGRVLGIFFIDPSFLARPDFSRSRFAFFLKTLKALREELREAGGDLLVLEQGGSALEGFPKLLDSLRLSGLPLPTTVSFNRDYEPFARDRDTRIHRLLQERGVEVHTERDHLLLEPHEVRKDARADAGYYQVYSPFARRWFEALQSPEIRERIDVQQEGLKYLEKRSQGERVTLFRMTWRELIPGHSLPEDVLDSWLNRMLSEAGLSSFPEAGTLAAWSALDQFRPALGGYKEKRDFPSLRATSRMSLYLKNGSITTAQIIARLGLKERPFKERSGPAHYLKELAWREFYYHILWHRPDVERQAFQPHYENLPWHQNEEFLQAWKEGRTGFPIVDAGMRELKTTGWMHNRVRMIVASFLTKDLLIHWKEGERYFMEKLLDGDLAPNNGGWQWAAGTGCDPQPWFRIFNPELQSRKFDTDGDYIRRHVPELRHLGPGEIHNPDPLMRGTYPAPIVDHRVQREKALALFREVAPVRMRGEPEEEEGEG